MFTKTTLAFGLVLLSLGCSGAPSDATSSVAEPVTQACCTVNGTTACAGPTVAVQWLDTYWTSNPTEDDAGPCLTGQACSAYAMVDGGLQPIGTGTCE